MRVGCVIAIGLLASGCATAPKYIDGQKVIATKWVNNRVVYVVEGNKEIMLTKAEEAKLAAKGVVFTPSGKK